MVINGVNLEDLPQILGYNADGSLAYIQVSVPGINATVAGVYRQSFTYTSGNLTGISDWVKQ